jgi:hypothetical protein
MTGPKPRGFWTRGQGQDYGPLVVGRRYRVVRPFTDFDRVVHEPGEEWAFLGYGYLPYDAGLSLFVSLDGEQEWHIRLQVHPREQGPIVDQLGRYLKEAE